MFFRKSRVESVVVHPVETCRLEVDTILDNDDNTLDVLAPKMLESAQEGFSSLTVNGFMGMSGSCCRLETKL